MNKHNHSQTIRMPRQWNRWVYEFANRWQVSKSFIIRAALREFIDKQNKQKNN